MRNNSVNYSEFGPVVQEMPFSLAEQNHLCNFGRNHHEEQFCEIIFNLDQWFRKRCPLKISLIWSSGRPFVWAKQNHLCNFGRGHLDEQFCDFTLNLDQWFRRCCIKIFLI